MALCSTLVEGVDAQQPRLAQVGLRRGFDGHPDLSKDENSNIAESSSSEGSPKLFRVIALQPGVDSDDIICSLTTKSLDDPGTYTALSYCWQGDSGQNTITVYGGRVIVTDNLYAALLSLRDPSEARTLWIDQLCIYQDSILDRNAQVRNMGTIFRKARKVIVWLGEECPGSDEAMALPGKVAEEWPELFHYPWDTEVVDQNGMGLPMWNERSWMCFYDILDRPWFRRVWVIQEVVSAKSISVQCGRASTSWQSFVQLIRVLEEKVRQRERDKHYSFLTRRAPQYVRVMDSLRDTLKHAVKSGTWQWSEDLDLYRYLVIYVLMMVKDCEATDHRDKLYALHDILQLGDAPDYGTPIEELYRAFAARFVREILEAKNDARLTDPSRVPYLSLLQFIYMAGIANQSLRGLPSWVPDWSAEWEGRRLWYDFNVQSRGSYWRVNGTDTVLWHKDNRYCAGGDVEPKRLTLANHQDEEEKAHLQLHISVWIVDHIEAVCVAVPDEYVTVPGEVVGLDREGSLLPWNLFRGRHAFLTAKGRYGLERHHACEGDVIAVIPSGPVPVILRPDPAVAGSLIPRYKLICDAYVLGIMRGKVWRDGAVPLEEIALT